MDSTELREIDNLVSNAQITVTPEEIEDAKKQLAVFYKNTNYKGDIAKRVEEVITKSLIRWERAPKNFWDRCIIQVGYKAYTKYIRLMEEKLEAQKTGLDYIEWQKIYRPERFTNDELRDNSGNKIKRKRLDSIVVTPESLPDFDLSQYNVYGDSLVDLLDGDEKKFWYKRELQYRREFDFNDSSDRVLLEEVIYIEILLRRLRISKITGEYSDKIKGLKEDDLIENHRKALDKLGILRVQRIQFDSNIEGNVGEISLLLDEKLESIKNLKDAKLYRRTIQKINDKYKALTLDEIEEIIEEQSLLREVEKTGELNIIPQAVYAQVTTDIENKSKIISGVKEIAEISSENSIKKDNKIDSAEYSSLQEVF